MTVTSDPIPLSVAGLVVSGPHGRPLVTDVSFTVDQGTCLGIVGESGSGKTLTIRAIAGVLPRGTRIDAGQIAHGDGRIGMVFQDPAASLNPVLRVRATLREPLRQHMGMTGSVADRYLLDLLADVGVSDPMRIADSYPHELSGGLKQRVMIAAALAADPTVLLCDEPTTALDVTTQATILELLRRLRVDRGLTMVFVSHDLSVVNQVADEVAVMYAGHIVERGSKLDVITSPGHAYTGSLLRAGAFDITEDGALFSVPGRPPLPDHYGSECRFLSRCELAATQCERPATLLSIGDRGHESRCCRSADVTPWARGGVS